MGSLVEERLRQRAESEKLQEAKMASDVAREAVDAEVPKGYPTEMRRLLIRAYAKPAFTNMFGDTGVLEESLDVQVPVVPQGEAMMVAQVFHSFKQIDAIVLRRNEKTSFYPLDLFTHYEFEVSSTILGMTNAPLTVR